MRPPLPILCVGTTPALQRVMRFSSLKLDAVNRAVMTLDGVAGKSVNVAKVLRSLGSEVTATGLVGGTSGRLVVSTLEGMGVHCDFVDVAVPTRQCVTVLDDLSGSHTELVEESRVVAAADFEALWGRIRSRLPGSGAVVMSGTIAPGGAVDFYERLTRLAGEMDVLSLVDAQGPPLLSALRARPGLVKPNRVELESTLQRPLAGERELLEGMRELSERGAARVVVTAGGGAILAWDGVRAWRIRPPVIKALNPIGSGDAFTAGLAWKLVAGDDLGEACRWGAASGSANAMTWMAGEVDAGVVKELAGRVEVSRVAE